MVLRKFCPFCLGMWVVLIRNRIMEWKNHAGFHQITTLGFRNIGFRIRCLPQIFCTHKLSVDSISYHDDVIKWKHFPCYWPFVRGIHRSPVNSPHKGQWRVALMLSLICAWINGWVNNREAGNLRRHHAHYGVIVMCGILLTDNDMISGQ